MKKVLITAAGSLVIAGLSQTALANFALYNDTNHFYAGASADIYHYEMPDVGIGSNGSKAVASSNSGGTTIMPKLNLGYHFDNDLLTSLFGSKANVELDTSFFKHSTSNQKGNLGSGTLYSISGNPLTNQVPLSDYHFSSDDTYFDTGLFFKGHRYSTNQAISSTPMVGLVFTRFSNSNDYGATFRLGNPGNYNYRTDSISEDTTTDYYGFAFGDQLNLQLTQHVAANFGGQLQLLRASASFDGSQNVQNLGSAKASDSESQFTYRAILGAGIDYKFSLTPDSTTLGLNLGYDRWGFTPEVVNPTESSSKAAYLDSQASNNFFAGLNLHVPL